jgi:hypothetical protein
VAIRVPTVQEEAVRDLCRARADMVADRTRARHRLGMFLAIVDDPRICYLRNGAGRSMLPKWSGL